MKQVYRIIYAVVVITTAFLIYMPLETEFEQKIIPPKINEENKDDNSKENLVVLSHKKINVDINKNKQVINILELENPSKIYSIVPVLSHDSIFGFETTTSMAKRTNADAAVNGGFFYPYGQPAGIIVIDGMLCSTPKDSNNRKIFIQDNKGKFYIKALDFEYYIQIGKQKLKIDGVNREPIGDEIILFTAIYGRTNRLNGIFTYNLITQNKYLNNVKMSNSETELNLDEFVITSTGTKIDELKRFYNYNRENYNKVEFIYNAKGFNEGIKYALEGGFWIVKDKKILVKKHEPWVGLTTNREPRTAIGIKEDGKLLLITIDGRQTGYSVGVSGKELGAYLIQNKITDALMLDGGASTTMVVKNKLVNRPSYRNKERMIGGSICIIKK